MTFPTILPSSEKTEPQRSDSVSPAYIPQHVRAVYENAVVNCYNNQNTRVLGRLLTDQADVFRAVTDVGLSDLVQHSIPNPPDIQPINQPPWSLDLEKNQEVDRQVNDLVSRGMVEQADSTWSSPVVLVKTKDGSWRLCIDCG